MTTRPDLFIIESLDEEDERENSFEGRILSDILKLSGKRCEYRYIRTKRELKWAVQLFINSNFRYLHISCHGNPTTLFTALEEVSFVELGEILRPALSKKRLFVSACSMTNIDFANAIIPKSGCISVVGPQKKIGFGDAALLWASFYHLMFKRNKNAMIKANITEVIQSISTIFQVPLEYYSASSTARKGYTIRMIRPKLDIQT